jgi:hypothetical protein
MEKGLEPPRRPRLSLCAREAGGGFTMLAHRFEECRWRLWMGLNEDCAPKELSDWHSPILYSVYVLIALALGEYGAIDRSADPKGKLQLTVF